jgi:hypothetical protein
VCLGRPYAARHITLPTFRGTPSWAILQQLVKESGVREPLLVLADGRIVDGVHRLELAKALGLPEVPVRVLTVPQPLRDEDRIQLETTLTVLAVGRRHIAPSRVQGLLLGLTQAELGAGVLNRGVANLRRGRAPAPGPEGPTQRALAASAGVSDRTARRLVRLGRDGPEELRRAVASGDVSVKEADRRLAAARADRPPGGPLILRARPTGTDHGGEPGSLGHGGRPTASAVTTGASRDRRSSRRRLGQPRACRARGRRRCRRPHPSRVPFRRSWPCAMSWTRPPSGSAWRRRTGPASGEPSGASRSGRRPST